MPGVVNGVGGRFVSAVETIVSVSGLNMESKDFSFLMSDDKG